MGEVVDAEIPVENEPVAAPTLFPRLQLRRMGWSVVGLVIAPVILVAAVLVFLFAGDSPTRLTLSKPAPGAAGPTASGDLAGTWTVGAGSVAGYRVREKLASLPVESEAVGRTGDVVGTVEIRSDGDRSIADAFSVQVNVSSLVSDEKPRDNRIRTSGLESNRFPTASFVGSSPVVLPPGLAEGEATTVEIAGVLTLHGVARQVTIPLQVRLSGERGEVVGSLAFPFADYDMSPPNIGGFVTVDPGATLEFQLFLERAA